MSEEPKKKTRKPRASKKKKESEEKPQKEQVKQEQKTEEKPQEIQEIKTEQKPEASAEQKDAKQEEPKEEKKELPKKPELTPEQIEEISKQVEIPTDQTPSYKPEIILSPEFGGTSNYELGIKTVRQEIEERLERLRSDPDANQQEIRLAEEDLKTLDYLYQNYYLGMNVFRTAKGGRAKIRE